MKVKALVVVLCLNMFMAGTAFALRDFFDFNTATAEEMVAICAEQRITLDPAVAAAIVAYRDANGFFRVRNDLLNVRGFTSQLFIALDPQEKGGSVWFDPSSAPSGMHGY